MSSESTIRSKGIRARKAILPDAAAIHALIEGYAKDNVLLPRPIHEISENVRDFTVVEDESGNVVGCGALHIYGLHLTEVRSIAVSPSAKGRGAGRLLVETLLAEAKEHQITCVCLFTRTPGFFGHLGFQIAKRDQLPDKIYKDCVTCPFLNNCDEVAMIIGEIPQTSVYTDPGIRIPLIQIEKTA